MKLPTGRRAELKLQVARIKKCSHDKIARGLVVRHAATLE